MACSSCIRVSEYIFEWKFSSTSGWRKGDFAKSDIFYAGADQESTWYMKFYPSGVAYASEGFASWGLVMVDGKNITTSGKVIMKYEDGTVIAEDCRNKTFARKSDESIITNFVKKDKVPRYPITISCELKLSESNILPYVRRIKDFNYVLSDIHSLLSAQKETDMTVVSQDQQEFRVHKTVLAARSDVFAAMFQNECLESLKNRIEICDMTGHDLQEMLLYIYSGNLSQWSCALCMSLYEAGDKYKINGLSETCSRYLQDNLTVDVSVRSLILSDMHSDENFKKTIIRFMEENVKSVLNSPDWKAMVQEHPHLVNELILAISKCPI